MSVELALPSAQFQRSFLEAEQELALEGMRDVVTEATFAALLRSFDAQRAGTSLDGRVPSTTLWLVESSEYLGRISIRHVLNPTLEALGGHIGYAMRPSRRRQGHGHRMLALALPHAAALGIDPALVTCDATNLASRKMIERCRGVFTSESPREGHSATLRFWIPTQRYS